MITKEEFEKMVDWIKEGILIYQESKDLGIRVPPVEMILILRRFLQVCEDGLNRYQGSVPHLLTNEQLKQAVEQLKENVLKSNKVEES